MNGIEVLVTYNDTYTNWVYDDSTGESWEESIDYEYTVLETVYTDPNNADSDFDLLPDKWERDFGFNPKNPVDGLADADFDNLSNGEEYLLGTDYLNPDSDWDEYSDGMEVLVMLSNPLDKNDPEETVEEDPPIDTPVNGTPNENETSATGNPSENDEGVIPDQNTDSSSSGGDPNHDNSSLPGEGEPNPEASPEQPHVGGLQVETRTIEFKFGDYVANDSTGAGSDDHWRSDNEDNVDDSESELNGEPTTRDGVFSTSAIWLQNQLPKDKPIRHEFEDNLGGIVNCIEWLSPLAISPNTDWLESSYDPAGPTSVRASFTAPRSDVPDDKSISGEGTIKEVRLVNLAKPESTDANPKYLNVEETTEKTFLKVVKTRNSDAGENAVWKIESAQPLKFTIISGKSISSENDLSVKKNYLLRPPMDEGTDSIVDLLPVEIVKLKDDPGSTFVPHELVSISSLNVSKMEKSLDDQNKLHLDGKNFSVADPDLFFIRIPGFGKDAGPIKVMIETTKKDGEILDEGDEITLTYDEDENALISKSLLLVSDQVDDSFAENGIGADNSPEDRTHLAEVGGKVRLKTIKINDKEHVINADFPVKEKLTVVINARVFTDSNYSKEEAIELIETKVRERFAQVGVRVEVGSIEEIPPPQIPLRATSSDIAIYADWELNEKGLADEGFWTIESGRGIQTAASSDIWIFFCKRVRKDRKRALTNYLGYAWSASKVKAYASAYPLRNDAEGNGRIVNPAHYANNCFINGTTAKNRPFTAAHEIGHLLTNRAHFDDVPPGMNASKPKQDQNLMRAGTSPTNTIGSSKRLQEHQEKLIHEHPATK